MSWYLTVLKKYAVFSGRARRKEFWYFVLFNMIFAVVAWGLDYVLGITIQDLNYGPIYLVYVLAIILPNLGVAIRRLHDIGKSGWWILIELIPLIGSIWLIVLFAKQGESGENKYGPDPKQALAEPVAG